jgi:hypothetical protein
VEEEEVKNVFKAYLDWLGHSQYFMSKGSGPDFEFEDGSVAEVKGSKWEDVSEVLEQIAEYYLKRSSVTLVAPADAINLDRAFRLLILERVLMRLKRSEKSIGVFLVDKVADDKYAVLRLNSLEDLWKQVGERILSRAPFWFDSTDRKVSFISEFSSKDGNELFKSCIVSIVKEKGFELELKKSK